MRTRGPNKRHSKSLVKEAAQWRMAVERGDQKEDEWKKKKNKTREQKQRLFNFARIKRFNELIIRELTYTNNAFSGASRHSGEHSTNDFLPERQRERERERGKGREGEIARPVCFICTSTLSELSKGGVTFDASNGPVHGRLCVKR